MLIRRQWPPESGMGRKPSVSFRAGGESRHILVVQQAMPTVRGSREQESSVSPPLCVDNLPNCARNVGKIDRLLVPDDTREAVWDRCLIVAGRKQERHSALDQQVDRGIGRNGA